MTERMQEFVVAMEPEYEPNPNARAAERRTITVSAPNALVAALAAVGAFTGKSPKTLKNEGRDNCLDPKTLCRFLTRANSHGNRMLLVVDLSAAEKQRIADAVAAEAAAHQAMEDDAKPDEAEYEALRAAHPGILVSLSRGYVRIEWKAEFGVEGADGYDYVRIEVQKDTNRWDSNMGWKNPASVRVGNGSMKTPAVQIPILLGAIKAAAVVAALLDTMYPVGSSTPTIPEDANPIAASYRAHTALLLRVVEMIAAAQTGGAS